VRVKARAPKRERFAQVLHGRRHVPEKRRINPLCEDGASKGITTLAAEVHHVESLASRPKKALDLENVRSLCRDCHRAYGRKEARGDDPVSSQVEKQRL
jgi:5-methylcytosine-specific restriction endonuclease McrA